jgi:hypothetical protein
MDSDPKASWVTERSWPNRENKTLSGCVYGMLLALDRKLGLEGYVQGELPV